MAGGRTVRARTQNRNAPRSPPHVSETVIQHVRVVRGPPRLFPSPSHTLCGGINRLGRVGWRRRPSDQRVRASEPSGTVFPPTALLTRPGLTTEHW